MANINFIWLGDIVPEEFMDNYRKCYDMNRGDQVKLWRDNSILQMAKEYGIDRIYSKVNLVNKINLSKLLVLYYSPGVYCDLDITWKRPVKELVFDLKKSVYNGAFFPNHEKFHPQPEFISCVRPYTHVYKKQKVYIFDDHLMFMTKDVAKKIIDYSRDKWINRRFDFSIKFEPFGPVSITEMIFDRKIKAGMWDDSQCQARGIYCDHKSTRLWDPKPF